MNFENKKILVAYVFIKQNTVREYANLYNINYSTAIYIKNNALKLLLEEIRHMR